ncbi:MAG: histidine kinase [Chloroflexota bacterium]
MTVALEKQLQLQKKLHLAIEVITSTLEQSRLFPQIVQQACHLIDAETVLLGLIEPEQQIIRIGAAIPDQNNIGREITLGQGHLQQLLPDNQVNSRILEIPILWHEQLIGVLSIGVASPGTIKTIEQELLTTFARHIAIALDNSRRFEETRQALDEADLMYRTSRRISTALEVDDVIEAYLEQVAVREQYACSVVLYELNEAQERTAVILHGRWTVEEGFLNQKFRYPHTRDALDPPLDAGQTITIEDVHTDSRVSEELRNIQRQSNRPALAFIPLMVRGARIGLVILSYPEIHVWDNELLQPYQATATQLALAIDSRWQQQLLNERGQQVAVLEERQRLARDLHDSVTQIIFSMTLIAQSIVPAWQRDPQEGEHRLNRLLELSQAALAEMRALLAELRPPETLSTPQPMSIAPLSVAHQLQQEGLAGALRKYITHIGQDDLSVSLDTDHYQRQSAQEEEALYRITQEALNNVMKHAQAHQVNITLESNEVKTNLTVTDDGVGFTPVAPTSKPTQSQLGLTTMQERAAALGGTVQFITVPNEGTTIVVSIAKKG